jgi:Zn-dependent metalloprotease
MQNFGRLQIRAELVWKNPNCLPMCIHKCCHIVPPYILEALARRGSQPCKRALNDTRRILRKRDTALNNLLSRPAPDGNAARLVYNCKHRYEQRIELVRKENGNISEDKGVNSAFDTSGYVRDYYLGAFGLNSMDNNGMPVISNVHYGVSYNNAYWDGDEMTFGDGDGIQFTNFASAIDVVAHELTHGVTQFMANLDYHGQSGALNEHFSDVFATIIKQKYQQVQMADADWLIGDTIVTAKFPGKALRSMKDPGTANDFDIQPGHMKDYYTGTDDNGGVHINSGIPNRAFYLTAMETGIGPASIIWFESMKALWRTSNFKDMRTVTLETCHRLVDVGKIPGNATAAVDFGFAEVGLNADPA